MRKTSESSSCFTFKTCDENRIVADEMQGLVLNPQKPSVLLHACCGPCATSCVERLTPDYAVTVYYYNPNITDRDRKSVV